MNPYEEREDSSKRSTESSAASVKSKRGDIPRPSGKPRATRGFTKSRLKAGVSADKYLSGSTTASESAELEESSPAGQASPDCHLDEDSPKTSPDCHVDSSESTVVSPHQDATLKDQIDGSDGGSRPGVSKKKAAKTIGGCESPRKDHSKARHRRGRHRLAGSLQTGTGTESGTGTECSSSLAVSSRRLSFVDLSMLEIWQALQEEIGGVDWMPEFWEVLLTAPYPAACKPLAMRSLGNWVTAYNGWQAMGNWKPEQAPRFFNAQETQQILGLPYTRVVELLEVFNQVDPTEHPVDADLHLPVAACMSTCVMMSKVICKRQKIRFLLGVFDEDDNRLIDKEEFLNLLKALFHGASRMFVLDDSGSSDFQQRIEHFASLLFRRVLDIYEDQKGEMLEDTSSVPHQLMEDWLLGDDALNLPFTLFLERFSVPGQDEDPEIFAEEGQRFYLSHLKPVGLPLETALSLDSKILSRHEVVAAEKIFSHCISMGTFDISHAEAEKVLNGLHMDLVDLWIDRLFPALDHLEASRSKMTLSSFLKELCPQATARHLRMFHSWIKEYEHLENLRTKIRTTRQRLEVFQAEKRQLPAMKKELSSNEVCGQNLQEGDPTVNQSLLDIFQQHIRQQEEELGQLERLFSPHLQTASLPPGRFLKGHVPKGVWQTWNQILDLLDVESEETFRASCLLPKDVEDLLVSSVKTDSTGFNRARCLKFFCEVFNFRPPKN